jgi:hypothetical protein
VGGRKAWRRRAATLARVSGIFGSHLILGNVARQGFGIAGDNAEDFISRYNKWRLCWAGRWVYRWMSWRRASRSPIEPRTSILLLRRYCRASFWPLQCVECSPRGEAFR